MDKDKVSFAQLGTMSQLYRLTDDGLPELLASSKELVLKDVNFSNAEIQIEIDGNVYQIKTDSSSEDILGMMQQDRIVKFVFDKDEFSYRVIGWTNSTPDEELAVTFKLEKISDEHKPRT